MATIEKGRYRITAECPFGSGRVVRETADEQVEAEIYAELARADGWSEVRIEVPRGEIERALAPA